MKAGSLCTGYGGIEMALQQILPVAVSWVADPDPAASLILARRFPGVPNLGDITKVTWDGHVDILTAGFPCQDVSAAGRRSGLRKGNRTGLWHEVTRAVSELSPSLIILENVRGLLSASSDSRVESCPWCMGAGPGEPLRAFGVVLGDLAALGYDAEWRCIRASDAGAPHRRERVFIAAYPADSRRGGTAGFMDSQEQQARRRAPERSQRHPAGDCAAAAAHPEHHGFSGAAPGGEGEGAESRQRGQWRLSEEPAGGCRERVAWGAYEPAIRRWEAVTGRPAPAPTEPGRTGERLSPKFAEWLMGLPGGWVTDIPGLSRNAQLKALGNGVVPQQCALALRTLGISGQSPR